MPAHASRPPEGWLLYDGPCGFCSQWVPRWTGVLGRRGYYIDILQADWVASRLKLPPDEIAADIRLLLSNGEHLKGAEVYRHLMRRIWWAWPLYFVASRPVLRGLFDAAYRRFADNRYWISRTCHIPVKPATAESPPSDVAAPVEPR